MDDRPTCAIWYDANGYDWGYIKEDGQAGPSQVRPAVPPPPVKIQPDRWIQTEMIGSGPPFWLPWALGLLMAIALAFVWVAITGGPPSTSQIPGRPSPQGYPPSCATVGP